jgi:CHAT domain-containing protein
MIFAADPSASAVAADDAVAALGHHLTATRIEDLDLTRTWLVVLSACETSTARGTRLEGPFSLATSFLAAGVPAVLSTLWKIPDDQAAELMENFHAELAASKDPRGSLRAAQIAALKRRESLHWAAFQLIGAPLSAP